MEKGKDQPQKKKLEETRIREPFPPEETPQPPQVMDASKAPDSERRENTEESKGNDKNSQRRD